MNNHKIKNSFANKLKEEALKNIEVKINVLTSWRNNSIPFRCDDEGHQLINEKGNIIIDYVPSSVRQFLSWDGSQNCEFTRKDLPAIRTLNNSTLSQHKSHRKEVEELLADLKEKVKLQQQRTSKSEIIRHEAVLREMKINLDSALNENINLRRNNIDIKNKYQTLLRSSQGHEQEYFKNFQIMEKEIERLKSQVSALTKSLTKVYPLSLSHVDK